MTITAEHAAVQIVAEQLQRVFPDRAASSYEQVAVNLLMGLRNKVGSRLEETMKQRGISSSGCDRREILDALFGPT